MSETLEQLKKSSKKDAVFNRGKARSSSETLDDIIEHGLQSNPAAPKFVRKQIDFDLLDKKFIENAQDFCKKQETVGLTIAEIAGDLPTDAEVDAILNKTIAKDSQAKTSIDLVDKQKIEDLPVDPLTTMNDQILLEDPLFPYKAECIFDTEENDFVYEEETVTIFDTDEV